MEDVLNFGRGRQKLAVILRGCEGGGGNRRRPAPPYCIYRGGVRGGGGGQGGEREQICPCTKCSHVHVDYTLSLFLISPFCCCSLSQYKKNSTGTLHCVPLKVRKIENFFGFDFEFCVISLLVMLKY